MTELLDLVERVRPPDVEARVRRDDTRRLHEVVLVGPEGRATRIVVTDEILAADAWGHWHICSAISSGCRQVREICIPAGRGARRRARRAAASRPEADALVFTRRGDAVYHARVDEARGRSAWIFRQDRQADEWIERCPVWNWRARG